MEDKITAIAIDDEPQALELIKTYAERVPFVDLRATYRNPLDALPIINTGEIDLLFLDLNMPGIDGMSFYKSLQIKPAVIFTTAYAEYAAESYEVQALDYLLKPIEFQRFVQACNRYGGKSKQLNTGSAPSAKDTLYLKTGTKWIQLKWHEIVYLEKNENYLTFHTIDKKKILSRQNMNDAEEMVPEYFCRIHKSYVVNLQLIDTIDRDEVTVAGHRLPISESYKERFLKKCGIL